MNYEKDGEDYVARDDDGGVALRYRKVACSYRATALEVLRDHYEEAPIWAFGGGITPRDEKLHGPNSQRVIRLRVQEDPKTPLRAMPPKAFQFVSNPTEVVLRHNPVATGNVFYSEDERLGPVPCVEITCYVESDVIDRLWTDIDDRPDAEVSVEVIADLYQEETEIKYNEAEHTDHLYYAPTDWSLTDPYPHKVHGVSVTVSDRRRPRFDVDAELARLAEDEEKRARRPVPLRAMLASEFEKVRRSFNLIAFLLAAIAAAVIFK